MSGKEEEKLPELIKMGSLYYGGKPVGPEESYDHDLFLTRRNFYLGDSNGGNPLTWAQADNMLVSTQILFRNISWNDLNSIGYIFGRPVIIDGKPYLCRSLKVGPENGGPSEWDHILDLLGDSEGFWHTKALYFWGQDKANSATRRVIRGYMSARNSGSATAELPNFFVGFRPVLTPLPPSIRNVESYCGKDIVVYGQEMDVYGTLKEVTDYDLVIEVGPDDRVLGTPRLEGQKWCRLENGGKVAIIDREAPIWVTKANSPVIPK